MYNKGPFASWVPKPLMLLLILLFMSAILAVSAVYSSSMTDLSGALATYTEYITLANNATTIGMGISIAIGLRIKSRFRSKEIIVFSTVMLALLLYTIAETGNPIVLVIASLLIGFFKMFPLIEMMLPVMFILSPTGERGKFYAIFYPLSIGMGQLSSYIVADLMVEKSWQAPYYMMAMLMLGIAALSLIFQHNQRFSFKVPLYQVDGLSLVLYTLFAMSFNVGLVFMRQQSWFSSKYIIGAFYLGTIAFLALIYRQKFLKRKLIKFDLILKKQSIWHSLILLLFLGIYLSSSSIFIQYTVGILGYNNLINAGLNLWLLPGIFCSGLLAAIGFKKNWNVKYYILAGFVAFFIHTFLLYILIQPQMNIEQFYLPMFFKGLGMGILFIGIWFYGTSNMELEDMLGIVSILMIVRTFLATAIGGAMISWATYQSQWQSLTDSSLYLDQGMIENGQSIYAISQMNAALASFKIVLGSLCWLMLPIIIFVYTHHYGRFNIRRIILFRKVIKGSRIRGYRFASK